MSTRVLQVGVHSAGMCAVIACAGVLMRNAEYRFTYQRRFLLKLGQFTLSFLWFAGAIVASSGKDETLAQNTVYVILSCIVAQPMLLSIVVASMRLRELHHDDMAILRSAARTALPLSLWQLFALLADAVTRSLTEEAAPFRPAPSTYAAIVFLRTPAYHITQEVSDYGPDPMLDPDNVAILHYRLGLIATTALVGLQCALGWTLWRRCSAKKVGILHPVNAERHERLRLLSCFLLGATALFRVLHYGVHTVVLLRTTPQNKSPTSMLPAQGLVFALSTLECILIVILAVAAVR
eukprot:TRINITY_DN18396_c0_g1_i1.p2 TRINITY_DN18396_c0_g1~~TRINITY_DN18396_c0_g1_i1.p2  ORF type:complete len:294 (+),score=62.53 TRINITY_DN18396_c0_g1_i1:319-1200(+)